MESTHATLKRRITQSLVGLFSLLLIIGTLFTFNVMAEDGPQEQSHTLTTTASGSQNDSTMMWAFIAAAIAFGLGALGAGFAISNVGAAAMGAVAEKPEIAGQALIFVALAEGLVVFGFIMGLLILGKV